MPANLYHCANCGAMRWSDDWPGDTCNVCETTTDADSVRGQDSVFARLILPQSSVRQGVLSGSTINKLIGNGEIGVDPSITDEQIQPASLDLRLGSGLYDVPGDEVVSEPGTDDPVTINPWRFYLGHTRDVLDLPDYVIGTLAGRSTVGRLGIVVHKTAGIIDPGFEGDVTLEIFNFGERPITFQPGERVAQLVFTYTDVWTRGYDGKYDGQRGPTPAER